MGAPGYHTHWNMLFSVVRTARMPTTAAAMARLVSNTPRPGRPAAIEGAGRGVEVARATAAGADAAGAAARGAAVGAEVAAAGAAGAAAIGGAPEGPPGGKVGSLMVGAAEGLGGKLMRTVSFFGWTFPVSFFGGSAPAGTFGIFSAIKVISTETKVVLRRCQTLILAPRRSSPQWSATPGPAVCWYHAG